MTTSRRHSRVPAFLATLSAVAATGAVGTASAQSPHGQSSAEAPVEIEEGVDYRIYDRQGRRSSILAVISEARSADVLLVGEEHGDLVGHAVEAALLDAAREEIGVPAGAGRTVVLSLEMFERDVQYVVDEYLQDLISEQHFLNSVRPWPDYSRRYRPLVEMARSAGMPVVAANAPRRYVSRVSSHGPDALNDLSEQARAYLPPLPYPGPSRVYREQWDEYMASAMADAEEAGASEASGDTETEADAETEALAAAGEAAGADVPEYGGTDGGDVEGEDGAHPAYGMSPWVIHSQALWDAAMGHAITRALVSHLGSLVVHYAGSFHVERGTGIPERIEDYRPGTRVVTVVMTPAEDVDAWSAEEHGPLADFVVLTKEPDEEATTEN